MIRERRKPTRREWEQITSRKPVVRRIERRPDDLPGRGPESDKEGGEPTMTDRRDRDRDLRDQDRREQDTQDERNAERERRGEELRKAWRRRHPEREKDQPKKGGAVVKGSVSEEAHARNMDAPTLTPGGNGLLPRRNGYRGMLPSTWLQRALKVEYTDAGGKAAKTSGVLLDWYPAGVILSLSGAKTLVSWDRICLLEFKEEA